MRYSVKYRKPGQIEGNRLFDIPKGADRDAIRRAAEMVAGPNATITSISANDGSIPNEKEITDAENG